MSAQDRVEEETGAIADLQGRDTSTSPSMMQAMPMTGQPLSLDFRRAMWDELVDRLHKK
jgi:hypothetical protein